MSKLVEKQIIPAVNYHLTKVCNYKCKFCFGTFHDVKKNKLKFEEAKLTIEKVIDFGFEKITFSGGEPMLCSYLPELIKIAKKGGMTTSIVTNGSMLSYEWLKTNRQYLDWIAISIDSINLDTNMKSGRFNNKNGLKKDEYLNLLKKIKDLGYKLKINTVVSKFNLHENISDFINEVKPERWKIFQALPIKMQNDKFLDEFSITNDEYLNYLKQQKSSFIKESNYDMKGSYVMIDPMGRFFENSEGIHKYSSKIINVGIKKALSEVNYCFKKFIGREGLYNWK